MTTEAVATTSTATGGGGIVDAVRAVFPWRSVVLPWLASRLLSAGVIIGATSWPFDRGLRFGGFQIWDGVWYTAIARDGYGVLPVGDLQTRWPFFPLLPELMRGLDTVGLGDQASTVIVNQVALLLAFAGVYRIARRHASPRAATLAVWLCAVFPGSFVFSMIYPSAIFLAATVWAFVFVEDRLDVPAAACAVVAALVRPNGIFLVLALADRAVAGVAKDRARVHPRSARGGRVVHLPLGSDGRPARLLRREVGLARGLDRRT